MTVEAEVSSQALSLKFGVRDQGTRSRPDSVETFARQKFAEFLQALTPARQVWDIGPDPPDWMLTLAEGTYAVEVTRIVESIAVGSASTTEPALIAFLDGFVKSVEAEARRSGLLRGCYLLHVCPVPDFSSMRAQLRAAILSYLSSTGSAVVSDRRVLWGVDPEQRWTIEKTDDGSPQLSWSMSLTRPKTQGVVLRDLERMLRTVIQVKSRKLAAIECPKVLLLVDKYHFGDPRDWRQVMGTIDQTAFHTIARLHAAESCQVLFSRNLSWL